jgi:Ni2+-binding GTPase involved in maturation of urease and hydrogenase
MVSMMYICDVYFICELKKVGTALFTMAKGQTIINKSKLFTTAYLVVINKHELCTMAQVNHRK